MPERTNDEDLLQPPSDPTEARKISVLGDEAIDRGQWTGHQEFCLKFANFAEFQDNATS